MPAAVPLAAVRVASRQAAAWLLGGLCATDWVDGYLARRLGQTSEFGKKFDPTVDRVVFVVAIVAIMINGAMPIWWGTAVLVREVAIGVTMVVATLVFGMKRFDVTYLGKLATFLLMFAVPGFLMAESDVAGRRLVRDRGVVSRDSGVGTQLLHRVRLHPEDPRRHPRRPRQSCVTSFVTVPAETVRLPP